MISLNFRKQSIRDMIVSGTKTIETRALNPEEPEKYFGDVQVGDIILLCNKLTGEELQAKVVQKRVRKNFDALWIDQEVLQKVLPDDYHVFDTVDELRIRRESLAPGTWYASKCEQNGIVGWEIELIDQIGYLDDRAIGLPYESFDVKMRYAGKGVVIDQEWKVAIIHSTTYGGYELPWGHIDPGEDKEQAFVRECREEIGCDIEIIRYIGYVIEHRYREQYKKTSYYFVAKLIGEKWIPQLEAGEQADGLETLRISPDELRQFFAPQAYDNIERQFVQARDAMVVERFLES